MVELDGYQEFLRTKGARDRSTGLSSIPRLCPYLKPFQAALTGWALRRGRAALFEGTGLGKTLQQLAWARVVADHVDGKVLILTPLAVAEQTVKEAQRFGISGVHYAGDQSGVEGDLVVTNYERFEKFHIDDFCGIVLDESGIIKSHDGKTRAILTEASQGIPWRLCCTATPAPNDYAELGQHAEFLSVMTAKEMLSMFFVHDRAIRANGSEGVGSDGWRLKGHAGKDFWRWLASWAAVVRHPRDLGFDDSSYDLPPLVMHDVKVSSGCKPAAGFLFPEMASTLRERIGVRRDTAEGRVQAAVDVVLREPNEPWLVWCNLNVEGDMLEKMLPRALQVAGRHDVDVKVSRLLGFKEGTPLILISKPSLAGHGMNWQHCARMVFVGLTDSFEQVYQAIRRCWRYGQLRPVECYFIASELEGRVVSNLRRKEKAHDAMLDLMSVHMRELVMEQVIGEGGRDSAYVPSVRMELPSWL